MPAPNQSQPPSPYEYLAQVPSFSLTSSDIAERALIDKQFVADANFGSDGDNVSPQLEWAGFPEGTQSFAVTCFDPDAPTGSGFWHWVLFDVPASVTSLDTGTASGVMPGLPAGAIHAHNDAGQALYTGPFPPAGHGPHRYIFAVHALSVPTLGIDSSASPAVVGFNLSERVLARGVLTAIYEVPVT